MTKEEEKNGISNTIFLQIGFENTWCEDRINETDEEYIRKEIADLKTKELKKEVEEVFEEIKNNEDLRKGITYLEKQLERVKVDCDSFSDGMKLENSQKLRCIEKISELKEEKKELQEVVKMQAEIIEELKSLDK